MTDVFSPEKRSAVMRRVKGRDTSPELHVRRLLRAAGVGYRLGGCGLPGRPDLVMKGRRLAVFVHGCFWHGHDCPRGSRKPKANADYWSAKIDRNRARDAASVTALVEGGWRVEVIWECELKAPETAQRLLASASVHQAASASAPSDSTSFSAPIKAAGVRGLETK